MKQNTTCIRILKDYMLGWDRMRQRKPLNRLVVVLHKLLPISEPAAKHSRHEFRRRRLDVRKAQRERNVQQVLSTIHEIVIVAF